MAYYDVNWHTELTVDASPVGLGAVLAQINPSEKDEHRIVAYGSRILTETEKRYSHIEKEALAIIWACQKFHLYIYATRFTLVTDNRALQLIISNSKSKPTLRIERWALKLAMYNFNIIHRPGSGNIADYLSRQPVGISTESEDSVKLEEFINMIELQLVPKSIHLNEIIAATVQDNTMNLIKAMIVENKIANNQELKPFKQIKHELSITANGVILRGQQIVIPKSLQKQIVNVAHEGHLGITKTKSLREKVWFPKMDQMVESMVKSCIACQATVEKPQYPQLHLSPMPEGPWQSVSMDFYGPIPTGELFLVIIDDYSRFPIVQVVNSTAFRGIKERLDDMFSFVGIPIIVRSDNGPPFNGQEFSDFA